MLFRSGGQGYAGGHGVGAGEDAVGAQVVLDVTGACALDDAGAVELVEDKSSILRPRNKQALPS